jgi:hypothetical protein
MSYSRFILAFLWGRMDSNHRKRKLADLQSAPFGHSGTPPYLISMNKPSSKGDAKVERFFLTTKY